MASMCCTNIVPLMSLNYDFDERPLSGTQEFLRINDNGFNVMPPTQSRNVSRDGHEAY
jgi:hypothetical protein